MDGFPAVEAGNLTIDGKRGRAAADQIADPTLGHQSATGKNLEYA